MLQRAALRDPLDTTTEIETPEHVRFRYHVAGPAKRALAYLIDLLLRGAIVFVIGFVAAVWRGFAAGDGASARLGGRHAPRLFVVEWGYYVFFETVWSGRTPGKRALCAARRHRGGPPAALRPDSVLRNLLRAAPTSSRRRTPSASS